ncbi:MFS transporter [Aliikangiella marina]|nr:MFS transporter [Aliikangiella marina]
MNQQDSIAQENNQAFGKDIRKGSLVSILLLAKFIERFAYFGWRSILFVFLVENVATENRLSQQDISQIYGVVIIGTILMSLLGGFIGDKLNNNGRVSMIGFFLISAGFAMTWQFTDDLYLVPIVIISIGIGLANPNLTAMIGKLYFNQKQHLFRAYSANFLAINIGAFLAALVIGLASQTIGLIGAIIILSLVVLIPALLLHVFREKFLLIDASYSNISRSTQSRLPTLGLLFIIVIAINVLDELFWGGSIQNLMSNNLNTDLANLENFALIVTINCLVVFLFLGLNSVKSWKRLLWLTAIMTISLMLWQQSFQLYAQLGYGQIFSFVLVIGLLEAVSQPYLHALLIKLNIRFVATSIALISLVAQAGQAVIKVIEPESIAIPVICVLLIFGSGFGFYYLMKQLRESDAS